jgi:hypothetical protein
MASTKAFRTSARSTSGQVVASDTVDRRVFVYVNGNAEQRIAFSSGDQPNAESGFLIPKGGIEFTLQSGDEIYMAGLPSQDTTSFVYFLVTKVVV